MSANMQGSAHVRDPLGKLAVSVWTALWLLAAVLVSRRMAGAFTETLSPAAACLATTLVGLVSLVALFLFGRSRREYLPNAALTAGGLVALLPTLAIGGALVPGTSTTALAYLAGLCVVLATAGAVVLHESTHAQRAPEFISSGDRDAQAPAVFDPAHETEQGPHVTQWFKRHADPAGGERVEGAVQIEFAAGQKQAAIHVPFSPPLCGVPHVECELLAASHVRIKVAAVHSYGARLEARRSGPLDERLSVELRFAAVVPVNLRDAA